MSNLQLSIGVGAKRAGWVAFYVDCAVMFAWTDAAVECHWLAELVVVTATVTECYGRASPPALQL
jgi:hypothetical protein